MFTHHCTACDRRQLIFPSMVTGVRTTEHGAAVAFTCWCGADQSMSDGHSLIEAVAA
jgi:hypothetical protein